MQTVYIAVILVLVIIFFYVNATESFASRLLVTYHYAPWCPACHARYPIWEAVKEKFPKSLGVQFLENNEEIRRTVGINTYPTITLNNGREVITFDRPMTEKNLSGWIITNM